MGNLNVVTMAGIALIVALALSFGVGAKAVQAQTLFGLAHSGPDGPSTLYTIDPDTGAATAVGPTGFERCSGMDFRAGTLFATCEKGKVKDDESDTHVLIMIDPTSGTGGVVGSTGVGTGPLGLFKTMSDISFRNSDGALFAYLKTVDESFYFPFLATIDIGSTAVTLKGPTVTFGNGNGIAFSSEDELFHADEGRLNTLDQDSGTVVSGVPLMFPTTECPNQLFDFDCRVNAMDFNPDGILFASVNYKVGSTVENFLATIETKGDTKRDVNIIGQTVDGLDAIAFAPAATASLAKAELGDFKCYDVKESKGVPKYEEVEVTLADEFAPESITRVRNPEVFCTPVSMDGAEITDPTASLTCYNIKDVEGQPNEEQNVVVEKKIGGQQALTLKIPKLLCVPSTIVD